MLLLIKIKNRFHPYSLNATFNSSAKSAIC